MLMSQILQAMDVTDVSIHENFCAVRSILVQNKWLYVCLGHQEKLAHIFRTS